MKHNYEKEFVEICIKKKILINVAESCTGGLISSKIVSIANSSKVFKLGLITYSNQSKINFLNVPPVILSKYGAVSKETAHHMVNGLALYDKNISFSFAVTGIAGPGGGTKEKPVGLTFHSFLYKEKNIIIEKNIFRGERNSIREKAAEYALRRSIDIITYK